MSKIRPEVIVYGDGDANDELLKKVFPWQDVEGIGYQPAVNICTVYLVSLRNLSATRSRIKQLGFDVIQ